MVAATAVAEKPVAEIRQAVEKVVEKKVAQDSTMAEAEKVETEVSAEETPAESMEIEKPAETENLSKAEAGALPHLGVGIPRRVEDVGHHLVEVFMQQT